MLEFFSALTTKPKIGWDYTENAAHIAKSQKRGVDTTTKEFYLGRRIISRETPINGGIHFRDPKEEIIVVDDEEDQRLLQAYQILLRELGDLQTKPLTTTNLIATIKSFVQFRMPYNKARVEGIVARLPKDNPSVKLSDYINGGVCRHQALLTAYLLEKLISEKKIEGKVSVDRNRKKGKVGHAWARYTDSEGTIFILDPARNYYGLLEAAKDNENSWPYLRPEDKNTLLIKLPKILRSIFTGR